MTDRTPIEYPIEYPPSGSTIALIDFTTARPSSRLASRASSTGPTLSWHPKVTPYRLLIILSTVGLAAAKTATTCLNFTFASITLEWILGVVVFLFFYLLGTYEETNNRYFTRLFNFDCMKSLWVFLEKLTGFRRPYYISDEIDARDRAAGVHPPLTGYRILVTVVVVTVGMTKSALLYGQQPTEASIVECVFGVGIVTGLYLLGLYEASSTMAYPKLFHVDYSGELLSYITETPIVFLHLFGILFCSALSYAFYLITAMILARDEPTTSRMETIGDIVLLLMRVITASFFSTIFLGAAVSGVFANIYYLGRRYLASPLVQFIVGFPGVRLIPYVHRKYWLPTTLSFLPRPRFFYLKRLIIRQSVKLPWNLFKLYIMIVVLTYGGTLSLAWYACFMTLLAEAPWYGLLIYCFMSLFAVPALLAGIPWVIYLVYKGFIDFLFEARKDFTVDVEPVDPPV